MLLGRRCIGLCVAAVGAGLLLSALLEGALLRLLLGAVLVCAGILVMKCC